MRFYAAEARYSASGEASDRKALLETLDRDIVLHQPASLPYGGSWRGREAFGEWLDAFTLAWKDIRPTDAVIMSCCDDMIVSPVTMHAVGRESDAPISMPMCQVIRFSKHGPVEWRNFAWDTVAMVAALACPIDRID